MRFILLYKPRLNRLQAQLQVGINRDLAVGVCELGETMQPLAHGLAIVLFHRSTQAALSNVKAVPKFNLEFI
jgi:hypothetical protein